MVVLMCLVRDVSLIVFPDEQREPKGACYSRRKSCRIQINRVLRELIRFDHLGLGFSL